MRPRRPRGASRPGLPREGWQTGLRRVGGRRATSRVTGVGATCKSRNQVIPWGAWERYRRPRGFEGTRAPMLRAAGGAAPSRLAEPLGESRKEFPASRSVSCLRSVRSRRGSSARARRAGRERAPRPWSLQRVTGGVPAWSSRRCSRTHSACRRPPRSRRSLKRRATEPYERWPLRHSNPNKRNTP